MSEPTKKSSPALGWMVFFGCAVGVIAVGLLATSINDRRAQSISGRVQFMTPVAENEGDNSKWGASFPREYNSWEATKQMNTLTKYAGSKERDYLAESPNLVMVWAGYPFAKDYNAPRGHLHAVDDVKQTGRRNEKTPGTCWTCKSPDVPGVMKRDGVDKFYAGKFDDYLNDIKNPIGCADCHNNETMALQISRPGLKEAFDRMGKDVTKATHQEMRSLVCAQCHVEYYFKGKKEKYLTFPWDNGTNAEAMEKYYSNTDHVDWTHAISGAKMIKMQHPDYEVYSQGIHAFRDVSCADCHMPYKSEGGIKFTDHQIRSPLENIANSCQVCHRWSEDDVRNRVTSIQDKTHEMLTNALNSITKLHLEIGDAMKLGAKDEELAASRDLVSKAQMYWDYVAAANGMGFHAPQESARVLSKSLQLATDGRLNINRVRAKYGAVNELTLPDVTSKELAQAYIKPYVDAQKAAEKAKEEAAKVAGGQKS